MPSPKFKADKPLYTAQQAGKHKAWRMDELAKVLTDLYAANEPVVVFVHGRGKEPSKSLTGGSFVEGLAFWKLQLGYKCQVLMFNWDSAFKGLNIWDREVPLQHTDAAAQSFSQLLQGLTAFQATHPQFSSPSLLAHSMGNFVIQKAVAKGLWDSPNAVFKHVILSQPDTDDVGHSAWLTPLADKESVFVTWNKDDHVLQRSTDARPAGCRPLGLGTTEPLATKARYIDLTNMGSLGAKDDDHEVFGKGAMNSQVNVCQFFQQAIVGEEVELTPANVEAIERGQVYRLKQRSEPGAPCLQVPKLPVFAHAAEPVHW